ncbi:AzlD domain-containing protein [Tolumonas auensis]|uniref:AzlD domain-containing protein n=1 Tax=Tolumonas auensis TaxID=43948 RepID=UPI002AA66DF4|nr:AzlD domain-containing protein [Tolumonas auensis]
MNHWTLIIGMMLVTFLPRYLPLLLAGKMEFPEWLERAFNYVPIAVLSAIIAQTTLIHDGAVQFNWHNAHLIAALVAFAVALKCRQQLVVISCGLLAFGLMRWWF